MAVNHYERALFLLWTSDAYREPETERRICPKLAPPSVAAYHRWSCYHLHPFQVDIEASHRASAIADYTESAEMRPIPMVNVTPTPSLDDNGLSLYMEVSHFTPEDDDFKLVFHCHSQLLSSSQHSVRSNRSLMSNESTSIALQQAEIEEHQTALELDQKFDKLTMVEDFDWSDFDWSYCQIRNRLGQEAWGGVDTRSRQAVHDKRSKPQSVKEVGTTIKAMYDRHCWKLCHSRRL